MKIIYVYDALCGWCYGFAKTFRAFYENHQSDFDFEIISGGMVTGDRIGPIGEVAAYISQAYKDVELRTGAKFGDDFLNKTLAEGQVIFTSLPPAIGLCIAKEMIPEKSVEFAEAIQHAIYFKGLAPSDVNLYSDIASELGLEKNEYAAKFKDSHFLRSAQQDFDRSKQLNVTGFPTIFLERDASLAPLARGYCDEKALEARLQQMLA